jgi:hypothetical protein
MVTQGPYPSYAQLSKRNAFTIRYCRQCVQGLDRRFEVVCQNATGTGVRKGTYIIRGG